MYRPGTREYVNEQPKQREKLNGETNLSERRLYHLLFLSIGVLCIIQAILNLSLRLTLYSSKTTITSACNTTDFGSDNRNEEEECQQMEPDKCRMFLKTIGALKNDIVLLKNRNGELHKQIKLVEEERERLKLKLAEFNVWMVSQRCPPDWREINSRCYFLSSEINTWEDSLKHCQSQGADLVIINSEQEQTAIYHLNSSKYLLFWIGLRATNGTFQWVDGSGLNESFWQHGQPDHGGPNNREDCVEMYQEKSVLASWNDAPCGHKLHWLCEKDPCSRP